MSSPVLATNPSYAGCASCCTVTHKSSHGTPSTKWGVRYCASVLDKCSDRMRHTAPTVFSHMDGAVGRAPLPPPVYWCEDNLPRVRKVPHHVLGS